jgi:hypothetical protein
MRAAALLMAVLMLTAGCLGMGGDEADDSSSDADADDADGSQDDGNDDASTTNDSTDSSGDHSHQAQPEKHWDNKTGEVDSTNVVVDEGEPAEETTEVPAEANEFSVTLSSEGNTSIRGEVYPPDCDEQGDDPGEDCSHTLDGDGTTYSTTDPADGSWTIRLWKAEPGTDSVPYTLEIWYLEEHEPGPGHHS